MTAVGIIGLGQMGRGMAASLRRAGYDVIGYDVDAGSRQTLSRNGVETVDDVAAVCASADTIVLSLPNADAVSAVIAGVGGILELGRPGLLVVDTTTSHPTVTRTLARRMAEAGMALVDAPVSGGPKGAREGTMTMVIGGADADVARVTPLLEAMSAKRVHVGPVGAGHVAKIVNNLLCAAHLLTGAEALRIAMAAEIEPTRLLEGLNAGSGRSGVTMVNLPTWVLNGAFDSGFTMKLMRKDVRLAADLLAELGLDLPLAAETARIWAQSEASIADGEDFNRIVELGSGPEAGRLLAKDLA